MTAVEPNRERVERYAAALRAVPGIPKGASFSGEFTDEAGERIGYVGDDSIFEDYARAAIAVADAEGRA